VRSGVFSERILQVFPAFMNDNNSLMSFFFDVAEQQANYLQWSINLAYHKMRIFRSSFHDLFNYWLGTIAVRTPALSYYLTKYDNISFKHDCALNE
jgi:hypothetical protein